MRAHELKNSKPYLLMVDYGTYEGWSIWSDHDTPEEALEAGMELNTSSPIAVLKKVNFKAVEND